MAFLSDWAYEKKTWQEGCRQGKRDGGRSIREKDIAGGCRQGITYKDRERGMQARHKRKDMARGMQTGQ